MRGGVSTHHPTRGLGERRKLPHRRPGQKWILCIFQVRKKPSGTPFTLFLSDGLAPKTSRGLGKLPPFSPLDGPGFDTVANALVHRQVMSSTKCFLTNVTCIRFNIAVNEFVFSDYRLRLDTAMNAHMHTQVTFRTVSILTNVTCVQFYTTVNVFVCN